jgi:hypothetical protein
MDALFGPASDPALFLLFSAGVHAAGVSPPVALEGIRAVPSPAWAGRAAVAVLTAPVLRHVFACSSDGP